MGAGSSVANVFNKENPRLKLFVSGKSIALDADAQKSFFTSFLDFDIISSNITEREVEQVAAEFCRSLGKYHIDFISFDIITHFKNDILFFILHFFFLYYNNHNVQLQTMQIPKIYKSLLPLLFSKCSHFLLVPLCLTPTRLMCNVLMVSFY